MVNGFKGVLVQQMDPETGALLGERRKVYSGSGIGCTEGPRIYHIGSWYYLVVAEGGTGYSHCVTIARSDNVFGPYETMPDNPLLTSDQNDLTAIQKCGPAAAGCADPPQPGPQRCERCPPSGGTDRRRQRLVLHGLACQR